LVVGPLPGQAPQPDHIAHPQQGQGTATSEAKPETTSQPASKTAPRTTPEAQVPTLQHSAQTTLKLGLPFEVPVTTTVEPQTTTTVQDVTDEIKDETLMEALQAAVAEVTKQAAQKASAPSGQDVSKPSASLIASRDAPSVLSEKDDEDEEILVWVISDREDKFYGLEVPEDIVHDSKRFVQMGARGFVEWKGATHVAKQGKISDHSREKKLCGGEGQSPCDINLESQGPWSHMLVNKYDVESRATVRRRTLPEFGASLIWVIMSACCGLVALLVAGRFQRRACRCLDLGSHGRGQETGPLLADAA